MCRRIHNALPVALPESSVNKALLDAITHHDAGRLTQAETIFRAIGASANGHPLASYGLGILCAATGRKHEAIAAYRHAIAIRPDFVDAHINLGTALLEINECEAAVDSYQRAIALSPGNGMAKGNLGKALQDLGRIPDAIAAFREAIALRPEDPSILANFGGALLEAREWGESAAVSQKAIALQPADAISHANLGTAMMNLGRHDEALAACRQAISIRPRNALVLSSLGGVMLELGQLADAVALCHEAIAQNPELPEPYYNLSHALKAMNELTEAEQFARQALVRSPDSPDYHFHLSHILLLRGTFETGWEAYEWRLKLPEFSWIQKLIGNSDRPPWNGEDIAGKTLLIYTEQGLGDIILFSRYLPLAARRAGRVIVALQPALVRLLSSIDGLTVVPIRDIPVANFDVHCPLLSLPRAFRTTLDTIPAEVPYLAAAPADAVRWRSRIAGTAPKVGIVWAGNPATKRDHFRSPGLASVARLFAIPGIDWVVLQVGAGRAGIDTDPLPPHVLDLGPEISDLADTAAIMSGLNLMISSCTAPLHLAGALGIPTWAMIPFAPYFPWLLDRTDSPWYPTMRLYRQQQPGRDWSEVVDRVAADLLTALPAFDRDGNAPSRTYEPDQTIAVSNRSIILNRKQPMNDTVSAQLGTVAQPLASIAESAGRLADMPVEPQPDGDASFAAAEESGVSYQVLHVGCGTYAKAKLPPVFRQPEWREIRLDIDPAVSPDVVASITNMPAIAHETMDAVYSSHNIEHLYPHEVSAALAELRRVLKRTGLALIALPDLQEVARHVANGKLEEALYLSPMGPIAPLDILFGHRRSLADGNTFMAHRTGFTAETLGAALVRAGFEAVMVQRDPRSFSLTAVAFRSTPDQQEMTRAQALMLPLIDQPAVLYALAA